jgi:hypothetical protein
MEKDVLIKRKITQDIVAKLDLYTQLDEFVVAISCNMN